MRFVIFTHSLLSDWNHGNAHFLRGVCTELLARGHRVDVYEPKDAWSVQNLVAEHGEAALALFAQHYPTLKSHRYEPGALELDRVLEGADVVLVHEWNAHELVRAVGEHRHRVGGYRLYFHDTHHRAVTSPEEMARYDLRHYDGVLAFGEVIRQLYLERGWAARAWTWHEAADVRHFRPLPAGTEEGDLIWVGNWGDEERTAELHAFLLGPVRELRLKARVHGVRYPEEGKQALRDAGIHYGGWMPNFAVPEAFSRFRVTVHVPRRPYVEALPGIPTIRVFEALACGIPLVSAPWSDSEGLFRGGQDFLTARNGAEMKELLKMLLHDRDAAARLAASGRESILAAHTCAHRVDQLLAIHASFDAPLLAAGQTNDERKVARA